MRNLLGFLAFVAVLIALVAGLVVPALVAPMVASAVRAALPFGSQPVDVQVSVDAIGFIRGFVGEIRISGKDLRDEDHDIPIGSVDVTFDGVGIGDHAFAAATGSLDAVTLPLGDATLIVRRVVLAGPSTALTATAHLDRQAAIAFIQHAFDEQGVDIGDVDLATGGISFVAFEQQVQVPLAVADGALVVPDMLGAGTLELLAPAEGDAWRLTGATITTGGMDLVASVDATALLTAG